MTASSGQRKDNPSVSLFKKASAPIARGARSRIGEQESGCLVGGLVHAEPEECALLPSASFWQILPAGHRHPFRVRVAGCKGIEID